MSKIVIFDWGGVIMHKHPVDNNDKQAIIRTIILGMERINPIPKDK